MIDCKSCGMDYEQKEFEMCPYCGHVPDDDSGKAGQFVRKQEEQMAGSEKDGFEVAESVQSKPVNTKFKYITVGAAVLVVAAAVIAAVLMFLPIGSSAVTVPDRYSTIQEAIDAADEGDEIVVDVGVYRENIDFNGKNITLRSTDPDDPEIVDQTIIDGGGSGSVVSFRSGEGEGAVLSGLTVTRGSGILISGNSNPIIEKCIVESNNAEFGAGIAIFDSSPQIINNSIIGNTGFLGGGLFIEESSPHIEGNLIASNRAEMGSGMVVISNSSPTIINNRIVENSAERLGGGIVVAVDSTPTIQGNEVLGNRAGRNGGGLLIEESEPLVEDNTISGNSSSNGAGIFIVNSFSAATRIINNTISNNIASIAGGGLYMEGSSPTIESNSFKDNASEHLGGGAAVYNSSPVFRLNTFESNSAQGPEGGGAIWVSADSNLDISDPDDNKYMQNNPDDLVLE